MAHNPGFLALVNDAKERIQECNIEALKQEAERQPQKYLILDVRDKEEYDSGHVPNAMHVSRGTLEVKIENLVSDKNQPILVYCGGGYRSALAADNLQKIGYKNVISVEGGMKAWRSAGFDVSYD